MATPYSPFSTKPTMKAVDMLYWALTRKITALIDVMARTKE